MEAPLTNATSQPHVLCSNIFIRKFDSPWTILRARPGLHRRVNQLIQKYMVSITHAAAHARICMHARRNSSYCSSMHACMHSGSCHGSCTQQQQQQHACMHTGSCMPVHARSCTRAAAPAAADACVRKVCVPRTVKNAGSI